jgi:hypothetical protein
LAKISSMSGLKRRSPRTCRVQFAVRRPASKAAWSHLEAINPHKPLRGLSALLRKFEKTVVIDQCKVLPGRKLREWLNEMLIQIRIQSEIPELLIAGSRMLRAKRRRSNDKDLGFRQHASDGLDE